MSLLLSLQIFLLSILPRLRDEGLLTGWTDRRKKWAAFSKGIFQVQSAFPLCCAAVDAFLGLRPDCALCDEEFIVRLQAHPDLRRRAEVPTKPECRDRMDNLSPHLTMIVTI
jgi:hypothetical protein